MNRRKVFLIAVLFAFFAPVLLFSQDPVAAAPAPQTVGDQNKGVGQNQKKNKRVLLIIPNYRTSPSLIPYVRLTPKKKFVLAAKDSFDPGTFVLGALFAGKSELMDSNPSFGHGPEGLGHYFATATSDIVIGDFMSEGFFPTILREDPRYFRQGSGTGWSRLGHAAGQIFWTHTDSNGSQFNFSEFFGNSAAVAISNAYYPESRNVRDNVTKLGTQVGLDMLGNILKEFWPDIMKKFSRNLNQNNP